LLHISYEGGILEDPNYAPDDSMWRLTVSPEKAPNKPQVVELTYKHGDVVAIDGVRMSPAKVLTHLNTLGGKHGIGRLDKVENRYVGMKSRGCYETPGGTILLSGHRAIESITLDREVLALKEDLMPRYARLVYNGYWFSPERELLQGLIDASQATANGKVRLKLYKGTIMCVGRESKTDSLFDTRIATFDDDGGAYNQADAEGFIKLNALRLRIAANLTLAVKHALVSTDGQPPPEVQEAHNDNQYFYSYGSGVGDAAVGHVNTNERKAHARPMPPAEQVEAPAPAGTIASFVAIIGAASGPVAPATGLSTTALKVACHRAQRRLRSLLDPAS
jgi:argininosuccinate synthase